jgi:polyisoprenoid-binding protein YceI
MTNQTTKKKEWELDFSHSRVGFSVRHLLIAKVRGQFNKWGGKVELDLEDLSRSEVRIEIDAASIDTRDEKRDEHLRAADFFDVANHPSLLFVGKRVEHAGADRVKLIGDLTIRGTTREVTLDVEYAGTQKDPWGGTRAGFSAHTRIDRRDFGLAFNIPLDGGGLAVGNTVDIDIELETIAKAEQASAAA